MISHFSIVSFVRLSTFKHFLTLPVQFSRCVEVFSADQILSNRLILPNLFPHLRSLKTIQGSRKTSCRFRLSHFVNLSLTLVRLSGLSLLPILARPSGFLFLKNSLDRTDLGYEDLSHSSRLPRKEVIQPHLPIRLPCYDFTPVIGLTFGGCSLRWLTDFGYSQLPWCDGRCVQGPGTYSPRHSDPRLLATPTSCGRVAAHSPNWDGFFEIRLPSQARSSLWPPL